MVYHILNGDSLAYSFPEAHIEGDLVVVREALIDGDLSGENLHDFWHARAKALDTTESEYDQKVVREFEKLLHAPDHSEFNLWFEYDLFCQANMWFVISVIRSLSIQKNAFVVYTSHLVRANDQFWNGYGSANAEDLRICFAKRIPLNEDDLIFGQALWSAYKNGNLHALADLAKHQSLTFPYLQEVVSAHIDRFPGEGAKGRPEQVIEDITTHSSTDFRTVCKEFWKRESIYGFGDTQLRRLYDKVMDEMS